MKLTQNNLLNFLNRHNLNPNLQKETDQIYIILHIQNTEVPVFMSVRGEGYLLQTIAYLPFEIHKSTLADLARVLHLINRELDMPGFGMDEVQRLMFYRLVFPNFDQELNEKSIELQLGTTRMGCESFMEAIASIISGTTKLEDIIKQKPNNG